MIFWSEVETMFWVCQDGLETWLEFLPSDVIVAVMSAWRIATTFAYPHCYTEKYFLCATSRFS